MTPKEIAQELVDRMFDTIFPSYNANELAKQCALIAVDEILNNDVGYNAYDGLTGNDIWIDTEYWQKVKQEIENYGNND
jgi:hypothetical protein